MPINLSRHERLSLAAIVGVGIALRLAVGALRGPGFADSGYAFYADIAGNFLSGKGLCYQGTECAVRMPLYPLVMAAFLKIGWLYPGLVVLQSIVGGLSPLLTYAIGRRLFTPQIAMIGAVASSLNPYAVVHDSALQETVFVNFLVRLGIVVLLTARPTGKVAPSIAGALLGCAVLTTARVALLVPAIGVWVLFSSPPRHRLIRASCYGVCAAMLVGVWLVRNFETVGSPVLTTEAGLSLWIANNEKTLQVYPSRSVDEIAVLADDTLDPELRRQIGSADSVEADSLYAAAALRYIADHPIEAMRSFTAKALMSFSGVLSPAREGWIQTAYTLLFVPVNVLALIGLWRARRGGPAHALVFTVLAAFVVTTTVFWAHTSHKSYLHSLKFIYAASVLEAAFPLWWAGLVRRWPFSGGGLDRV